MNTKNIKTAVIVMLVLANIFFAGNVYLLNDKTKKIPPQMIEDAVVILNRAGFEVTKEVIPPDAVQNYIYECVYAPENFEDIVKSLSGKEKIQEFPAPNEGITYIAGEGEYKFDFASERFSVNIVELPYFESLEPLKAEIYEDAALREEKINEMTGAGIQDVKKGDIKKAESAIKNFLKKYRNQSGNISFDIVGYEKSEDDKDVEYVVINQKFDGLRMNSHIVFVEINDKKVRVFVGKWYFGEFAGRYKMPLLDSVNILFKCLEKDGSAVAGGETPEKLEKMRLHYNIVWHESSKFYLSPSWTLLFETGKTLTYDAISGNRAN